MCVWTSSAHRTRPGSGPGSQTLPPPLNFFFSRIPGCCDGGASQGQNQMCEHRRDHPSKHQVAKPEPDPQSLHLELVVEGFSSSFVFAAGASTETCDLHRCTATPAARASRDVGESPICVWLVQVLSSQFPPAGVCSPWFSSVSRLGPGVRLPSDTTPLRSL